MLRLYQRLWQVNWAEQWQYRANLLMYLLYFLISPVVYLAVWTSVARSQGSVSGMTTNDFATYYLTMLIVDVLTFDITIHLLAYKIHDGTLSGELLKPTHPVLTQTLMNTLAFKALTLIVLIPVWLVLCLLVRPDFSGVTMGSLLSAVPALGLGFGISFFLGASRTCLAFWTTRVYALNDMYFAMGLILSGAFVPIDLMPPFAQRLAHYLPFQLPLYFPIQLILNRMPPDAVWRNFILAGAWFVLALLLFRATWAAGLKRFSAVGA